MHLNFKAQAFRFNPYALAFVLPPTGTPDSDPESDPGSDEEDEESHSEPPYDEDDDICPDCRNDNCTFKKSTEPSRVCKECGMCQNLWYHAHCDGRDCDNSTDHGYSECDCGGCFSQTYW